MFLDSLGLINTSRDDTSGAGLSILASLLLVDTKAEQSASIQILSRVFCRLAKLALDAAELNHEALLLNEILINILINNLEFVVMKNLKNTFSAYKSIKDC